MYKKAPDFAEKSLVKFLSQKDEQLTSIEGADMGEHIHPEKYRLKYIHFVLVFN